MYFKDHKLLFLHIPKTGGSSIEYLLLKSFGSAPGRHFNLRRFALSKKDLTDHRIFTVVRNPFNRIASTYEYFHRTVLFGRNEIASENYKKYGSAGFVKYVHNIKRYFDGELKVITDPHNLGFLRATDETGKIVLDVKHIERLSWWLLTTDGAMSSCTGLKFESLNSDWDKYKKVLGIKKALPHINRSPRSGRDRTEYERWKYGKTPTHVDEYRYMDYYTNETYTIIKEAYKNEIDIFGYCD